MAYKIEKTQDDRWGIYLKDDLLATVKSYELLKSISKLLNFDTSNR